MNQPRMRVAMRMRLSRGIAGRVLVPMMSVVGMAMLVQQWLVLMGVLVMFGKMEIKSDDH